LLYIYCSYTNYSNCSFKAPIHCFKHVGRHLRDIFLSNDNSATSSLLPDIQWYSFDMSPDMLNHIGKHVQDILLLYNICFWYYVYIYFCFSVNLVNKRFKKHYIIKLWTLNEASYFAWWHVTCRQSSLKIKWPPSKFKYGSDKHWPMSGYNPDEQRQYRSARRLQSLMSVAAADRHGLTTQSYNPFTYSFTLPSRRDGFKSTTAMDDPIKGEERHDPSAGGGAAGRFTLRWLTVFHLMRRRATGATKSSNQSIHLTKSGCLIDCTCAS